jgi:hypothetical protein
MRFKLCIPKLDFVIFIVGVLGRHLLADVGIVLGQVHFSNLILIINSN